MTASRFENLHPYNRDVIFEAVLLAVDCFGKSAVSLDLKILRIDENR